jgi:Eukaryotic-type carbonic anhydrase
MLKVVDQVTDWPELNKVICAWREAEEKVREDCGYSSIKIPYPGCSPYRRSGTNADPFEGNGNPIPTTNSNTTITTNSTGTNSTNSTKPFQDVDDNNTISIQGADFRKLQQKPEESVSNRKQKRQPYQAAKSMMDIIMNHEYETTMGRFYSNGNSTLTDIQIDHHNSSINLEDFDWDTFIAEQYKKDEQEKKKHRRSNRKQRRLLNYEEVEWFNYFPMLKVRTEYYYRYEGPQTIPPCYGKFIPNGDRKNTIAWRVMKDPILISQRQIDEIHRLLKYRIAPKNDPLNSCRPDTAAGPDPAGDPNKITVARPLQSQSNPHFTTFCECTNWKSKFIEDNAWCTDWKQTPKQGRFYERPYNFRTNLSSFI